MDTKEITARLTIILFLSAFLPILITADTTIAIIAAFSPLKIDATHGTVPQAAYV